MYQNLTLMLKSMNKIKNLLKGAKDRFEQAE